MFIICMHKGIDDRPGTTNLVFSRDEAFCVQLASPSRSQSASASMAKTVTQHKQRIKCMSVLLQFVSLSDKDSTD